MGWAIHKMGWTIQTELSKSYKMGWATQNELSKSYQLDLQKMQHFEVPLLKRLTPDKINWAIHKMSWADHKMS
jgi:hypothetical protein